MRKSSPTSPFSPGTAADPVPVGDAARQAVASLRGYAYQVAAAALAWLDLDASGRVYLEVAEDYSTVAEHSLDAVQVKDTAQSGSITLNTAEVREAINSFVTLVNSNRDRHVQLKYFTTSKIGIEQKLADRPAGEPGLGYWRKAAAGADVGPLRRILTTDRFSTEVRAFVAERNDNAVRRDLLRRIHWECGKPDISGIVQELEERLVVLGRERFGLPAAESKQLVNTLLYQVLKKSILRDVTERFLTQAELYSVIDAAMQVSVSRETVRSMLDVGSALAALMSGGQSPAALSAVETSWLTPGGEFATPRATIQRQTLVDRVTLTLAKYGQVILVGGSGLGKSLLARAVAATSVAGFATIDLRDVDEGEAARRLVLTLGRIGALEFDCLIFDDFNQIEYVKARIGYGRCIQGLHRRDRKAIVTAYRRPSNKALIELGLGADAVIDVPYLTEDEASEIVQAAGGDPHFWGKLAFAAGAGGHPQLVHAFVMGMSARGWPQSEVNDIVLRGIASDDTDAERDAARRSMTSSLPEHARTLLYRMSLVIGRFDRALALTIAEVPPPLQGPGELIDTLIGPWIEKVDTQSFRVSPLAANAGHGMLTKESQQAIHATIALQMLQKREITATEANGILMHALAGKVEVALTQLAYSIVMAKEETVAQLRDQFFTLALLRTNELIFADNITISILLRQAQFKLVAAGEDPEATAACAAALMCEVRQEDNDQLRHLMEGIALSTILMTVGIGSAIPNWIDLLQEFKARLVSDDYLRDLYNSLKSSLEPEGHHFFGILFSVGSANLRSVQRVEEIFVDLDRLSETDRSSWFENFQSHPADYLLLVNPSWVAEAQRNELNAADAAERFKRMALLAQKWRIEALASHCYVARAVMFDEYLNDPVTALAALDEAEVSLEDTVVISRARARIYWRNQMYHDAVQILHRIADVVGRDSPIDRAFAMREASISAANIGEWSQAATWFEEASKAAAASGTDDMQVMAIGLQADRAAALLESANVAEALQTMASCLMRLSDLDPSSSLRAGYCHRVVRHTVLWIDSKIDNRETLIDGKPIRILPGSCSNPEPPKSILDLPLAPLDAAWYMLAQADGSFGGGAGIGNMLPKQLRDGPIPFMEVTYRNRQITKCIRDCNVAGFCQIFLPHLEAMHYLHGLNQGHRDSFDPLNPERGEIPTLSNTELAEPTANGIAIDSLVAFVMSTLLCGAPDRTADLQRGLIQTVGNRFPGKTFFEIWYGAEREANSLDEVVIDGIVRFRLGEYLTPREQWEIGLRFFERVRQSTFRNVLSALLQTWMREQWKDIVTNGSFRLTRPMHTVPAIEQSLSSDLKAEAFIASLLLVTAEAVSAPLAAPYETQLRETASGDR